MAPSSSPEVPSHTRWLAMRLSSASSTRIHWARAGTSISSSFSTDIVYALMLAKGAR